MNYNKELPEQPEKIGEIVPDLQFLTQLLYMQTPSRNKQAQNALLEMVEKRITKKRKLKIERDTYGNMYITKGKANLYPCIVAHCDVNQQIKTDWEVIIGNKFIYGFDNETGEQCGCGHDDKVGLLFAVQMLEKLPILKVFLALDEEVGTIGSSNANPKFFEDCTMLVQLDRNSFKNDIIEYTNGIEVLSEEFKKAGTKLFKKYNYECARGVYTDIGTLKKLPGVDCIAFNQSCGYFLEHSSKEVASIAHIHNAFNLAYELISTLGNQKWQHISKEEPKPVYYPTYNKPVTPQRYTGKWDIWDDQGYIKEEKEVKRWHYVEGFGVGTIEDKYVQDILETGCCPACGSNEIVELLEEESYCEVCKSVFNIPEGKSMLEVDEEIAELSDTDIEEVEPPILKKTPRDFIDWREA